MKKGLFSILASALLVVGCQNYDDQFDNLETQINALASVVAGLSQVQSDISALSNTVASLQTSVASSATGDAALADGLADLATSVAAVQESTASAASSADVQAITDAVSANQADLAELLANSSVFSGDVNITSPATLAAFKAMGSSLAIVNGNVNIATTADMVHADVQAVVDEILTVTKDFKYTSHASAYTETTFNKLSGVVTLTLKQGGGYRAQTLASATNIILDDTWKSTVLIVDFRALTSVTNLNNESQASGYLKFDKATEMHLTKLALYPGSLNLQVKKGGVVDLSAFDDLNAAGTAVGSSFAFSIDGPASVALSTVSDGTITLANVGTATISGFIGNTVVGTGVDNLTVTGAVSIDLTSATDLASVNITGAKDSDPVTLAAMTAAQTLANVGPAITLNSGDLITATIAGFTGAISSGVAQTNLETLTISANTGTNGLTVSGNNDLTSLVVTGATIGDVSVTNNTDLETVTFDHTTSVATASKAAIVTITGNTNLTNLVWSADDVKTLAVTGNTALAVVNFAGLKDMGTSASGAITVKTNALVASSFKDAFDATAASGAVQADTGAFVTGSGMASMKIYLTAVLASATSDVAVYFDTLELVSTQASAGAVYTENSSYTNSVTGNTSNAYAYQTAQVLATGPTIRQSNTYLASLNYNSLHAAKPGGNGEGFTMVYGGVSKLFSYTTADTSLTGLINTINTATDYGTGITLTAALDGDHRSLQTIVYTDSSGAAETPAAAGSIEWKFGTVTGLIGTALTGGVLGTSSNVASLAAAFARNITGTVQAGGHGATYGATASGTAVIFQKLISGTMNLDRGPDTAAHPVLQILPNASFTTADLNANAVNTNSIGLNSDYYISTSKTDLNDLRITVKNNSTSIALTLTITRTGTDLGLGTLDAPHDDYLALVSGTTTTGNPAYVALFAEIADPSGGVAKVTKNRTGWL